MNEPLIAIVPSVNLGKDGATLVALFLFSERYICEVRVTDEDVAEFDICARTALVNYRFRFWIHRVKNESGEQTFHLAEVMLKHGEFLTTGISYVGDDREAWLAEILQALPVKLLERQISK